VIIGQIIQKLIHPEGQTNSFPQHLTPPEKSYRRFYRIKALKKATKGVNQLYIFDKGLTMTNRLLR